MERYIWESKRDIQAVINSLIELADKINTIDFGLPIHDCKSLKYKSIGNEVYRFDLWYYFAFQRFSYQPTPIFGTISATKDGCKIEINPLRLVTVVNSILIPLIVAVCFSAPISLLVTGDATLIPLSIIGGCFGTILLARFLYTRKKWISNNVLLDIIDQAAGVRHREGMTE